jgi:peptide/nickel transport system ATP-binding protein
MSVYDIIAEPLRVNGPGGDVDIDERVKHLAGIVSLNLSHLMRYPHAFSGGQRQRIGIARALATNPRLVVADEPVSALDVSVRAQVLNLLEALQKEFGLTYLFVSHDLGVVRYVSDRIAVMYVGKLVEVAEKDRVLNTPKHPYTESLLSAVPRADLAYRTERIILPGEAPDPTNLPTGCVFNPRCRYATDRCRAEEPRLRDLGGGHTVACHRAGELALRGISQQRAP